MRPNVYRMTEDPEPVALLRLAQACCTVFNYTPRVIILATWPPTDSIDDRFKIYCCHDDEVCEFAKFLGVDDTEIRELPKMDFLSMCNYYQANANDRARANATLRAL